jgi:hypothetical protein
VGQVRSILQSGHLAVNKCNFTLLQEGDLGQVRSILRAGHLAVNKCNFTLFRREMWGRCTRFSRLATWR